MDIKQTDRLREDAALTGQVAARNDLLQQTIGTAIPSANASWDVEVDAAKRKLLMLTVTDAWSKYETPVDIGDLESQPKMEQKMARLQAKLIKAGLDQRVAEWTSALESLFGNVLTWLEPKPTAQKRRVAIKENWGGGYYAQELVLTRNGKTLSLRPMPGKIVGQDGRVDLIGAKGGEIIVYRKNNSRWYWVEDRVNKKVKELTKELFTVLADRLL